MNIAFISYEYPPDTALGGIATYVQQAARGLVGRGHHVEVIAATAGTARSYSDLGVTVHTLAAEPRAFPLAAGVCFAERHRALKFDVLEGPEYNAEASEAVRLVPDIPLVVKMHTPTSLMRRMNVPGIPWFRRWRIRLGAWRRLRHPAWYVDARRDPERAHALMADEVVVLCREMAARMVPEWGLDSERVAHIPLPYTPSDEMLGVPCEPTASRRVVFLGRLEERKGVIELAKGVSSVAREVPDVRFLFVGRDRSAPDGSPSMAAHMRALMGDSVDRAEFRGGVPLDAVPGVLAEASVCVFPSHWENFPLVCLEAMSAGRAVVGSRAGGMAEMLDGGRCGVLIPPFRPAAIARAVVELLNDPSRVRKLGMAARARVLSEYNVNRILALQEESYARAMSRRAALGARPASAFRSNT